MIDNSGAGDSRGGSHALTCWLAEHCRDLLVNFSVGLDATREVEGQEDRAGHYGVWREGALRTA